MSVAHTFQEKARTADVFISESVDFSGLLLSKNVLKGLLDAGFKKPSPIQLKAIPLGRCGLDLIVQAKSGTGKTCVFTVIALENVDINFAGIQVLVLAPTREIALQIQEVLKTIGKPLIGLKCQTFIGGLPVLQDKISAKKCHIAIGTPGRIKQLIEIGAIDTTSIRLFVLDEADALLEGDFQEPINWIYSSLPENKQILALSATYPEYLAQNLTIYMRNPTFVRLNTTDPALLGIKQYFVIVDNHPMPNVVFNSKTDVVIKILSSINFQQCLIFSNMQTRAKNLQSELQSRNWPTACIAGCLDQKERNFAIEQLKTYKCRILISTDLTSRGIDADKVNLVINLDFPEDHEVYLHRIGRAGRFGSHGVAISILASDREEKGLKEIEIKCNTKIRKLPDPVHRNIISQAEEMFPDEIVTSEQIINKPDIPFKELNLLSFPVNPTTLPSSPHKYGKETNAFSSSSVIGQEISSDFKQEDNENKAVSGIVGHSPIVDIVRRLKEISSCPQNEDTDIDTKDIVELSSNVDIVFLHEDESSYPKKEENDSEIINLAPKSERIVSSQDKDNEICTVEKEETSLEVVQQVMPAISDQAEHISNNSLKILSIEDSYVKSMESSNEISATNNPVLLHSLSQMSSAVHESPRESQTPPQDTTLISESASTDFKGEGERTEGVDTFPKETSRSRQRKRAPRSYILSEFLQGVNEDLLSLRVKTIGADGDGPNTTLLSVLGNELTTDSTSSEPETAGKLTGEEQCDPSGNMEQECGRPQIDSSEAQAGNATASTFNVADLESQQPVNNDMKLTEISPVCQNDRKDSLFAVTSEPLCHSDKCNLYNSGLVCNSDLIDNLNKTTSSLIDHTDLNTCAISSITELADNTKMKDYAVDSDHSGVNNIMVSPDTLGPTKIESIDNLSNITPNDAYKPTTPDFNEITKVLSFPLTQTELGKKTTYGDIVSEHKVFCEQFDKKNESEADIISLLTQLELDDSVRWPQVFEDQKKFLDNYMLHFNKKLQSAEKERIENSDRMSNSKDENFTSGSKPKMTAEIKPSGEMIKSDSLEQTRISPSKKKGKANKKKKPKPSDSPNWRNSMVERQKLTPGYSVIVSHSSISDSSLQEHVENNNGRHRHAAESAAGCDRNERSHPSLKKKDDECQALDDMHELMLQKRQERKRLLLQEVPLENCQANSSIVNKDVLPISSGQCSSALVDTQKSVICSCKNGADDEETKEVFDSSQKLIKGFVEVSSECPEESNSIKKVPDPVDAKTTYLHKTDVKVEKQINMDCEHKNIGSELERRKKISVKALASEIKHHLSLNDSRSESASDKNYSNGNDKDLKHTPYHAKKNNNKNSKSKFKQTETKVSEGSTSSSTYNLSSTSDISDGLPSGECHGHSTLKSHCYANKYVDEGTYPNEKYPNYSPHVPSYLPSTNIYKHHPSGKAIKGSLHHRPGASTKNSREFLRKHSPYDSAYSQKENATRPSDASSQPYSSESDAENLRQDSDTSFLYFGTNHQQYPYGPTVPNPYVCSCLSCLSYPFHPWNLTHQQTWLAAHFVPHPLYHLAPYGHYHMFFQASLQFQYIQSMTKALCGLCSYEEVKKKKKK